MSVGIGAAIAIGGGLSAVGGIASGLIGAGAADDAANAQAGATRESIAAQERMAEKAIAAQREQAGIARDDLSPFRASQLKALGGLEQLAEAGNPFEKQQRERATQAIQAQLAAQGLLRSKKQVDLLGNLETDLASQAFQQRAGILSGLAGTGAVQTSAGISQGLGSGIAGTYGALGSGVGSSLQQLGQQIGAGQIGRANAIGGIFSGVNNAFQGTLAGLNAQGMQQQNMDFQNAILSKYGGGGGGFSFGGGMASRSGFGFGGA